MQREISGYAQLSQAAMKSTRMIADNVSQWKRTAEGLRATADQGKQAFAPSSIACRLLQERARRFFVAARSRIPSDMVSRGFD